MELHQWKEFVNGVYKHDPVDEQKVNVSIVRRIMDVYYAEAKKSLKRLKTLDSTIEPRQRAILIKRFVQIQDLIKEAFQNSFNADTGLALEL